ncbi:MAG: sporulation stage III protein AG [Tissierellia bacterium]|nr:sporulation stage III protein AG [Tissierellia bacterium]
MNDLFDKIKKHLESINNKKFINNLFIILGISIIFLIVANYILDSKKEAPNTENEFKSQVSYEEEMDYSAYLEKKLANILSKLEGVGKVNVMVTLENSVEKITATNTTKSTENIVENDGEGGTRQVQREDLTMQVVTRGSDGSLLVVKEIKPKVLGVIVIAEGADDPEVKEKLYEAVKTVLGITGNKVQVYSSK